jgi:hypothetical protein
VVESIAAVRGAGPRGFVRESPRQPGTGHSSVGLTGSTLRDIDGESRSQGSATEHGRRQMRIPSAGLGKSSVGLWRGCYLAAVVGRRRYVARGVPGGYRIWDNRTRRWWGDLYELCPDELLNELNGARDYEKITALLRKYRAERR